MPRWMQSLLLLVITFMVIPTAAHAHSQHVHRTPVQHQLAAEAVSGTDAVLKDGAGDVSMIEAVSLSSGSTRRDLPHFISACCCQGAAPCSSSGGPASGSAPSEAWTLRAELVRHVGVPQADNRASYAAPRSLLERPPKA